jgi:hypothetical protein
MYLYENKISELLIEEIYESVLGGPVPEKHSDFFNFFKNCFKCYFHVSGRSGHFMLLTENE